MVSFDAHDFHNLVHAIKDDDVKAAIDKIFAQVDTDHSGFFELNEVLEMLKQVAYHYAMAKNLPHQSEEHLKETANRMFKRMDANGDGKITKEEFFAFIINQRAMFKDAQL